MLVSLMLLPDSFRKVHKSRAIPCQVCYADCYISEELEGPGKLSQSVWTLLCVALDFSRMRPLVRLTTPRTAYPHAWARPGSCDRLGPDQESNHARRGL